MPRHVCHFNSARLPTLPVLIETDSGDSLPIDAVLDTGYSGFLCVPREAVESLSLRASGTTMVRAASGESRACPQCAVSVQLGPETGRGILLILEGGNRTLAGMDFLRVFRKALIATHDQAALADVAELGVRISE